MSTRARVAALRAAGHSPAAIALELELAINTVHYHVKRLSQKTRTGAAQLEACRDDAVAQVKTRQAVRLLLAEGRPRAEIARRLGIAKSTVSYHARRLGEAVDDRCSRRYDWEAIQVAYDRGASVRQCAEAFGFSTESWYAAVKRGDIVARPAAMPLEQLLVANTYRGREHVKRRLLQAGLKTSGCELCGLDQWLGRPVALALHHVNGDRLDNRLANLQLLCPNCHSQTPNFGGRNGHLRARPEA